jgi:hypothetical protein
MNSMHTLLRSQITARVSGLHSISQQISSRFARLLSVASIIVVFCLVGPVAFAQQGMLQTIREDVRGANAPPSSSSPDNTMDSNSEGCYEPSGLIDDQNVSSCADNQEGINADDDVPSALYFLPAVGAVIVSPLWVPHTVLGDDFHDSAHFLPFPYDGDSGYIRTSDGAERTRPFAVRLEMQYAETFSRLESISGHLLVETAPRFGLAASLNHLEERLPGGGRDQLHIGDCNLVYRFAQNEWAEFRTGLGFNWLNDAQGTDLGFNFTYAADLYPRKPWVLSAEMDAGTLGYAGLFRFRTTAGVVFHGLETYAGYEYTDIGRTHWNSLIVGLRLWF